MSRLSRFERKILASIGLVAFAPLVGALVLGSSVVRDAYQTGINERIHAQLEKGIDTSRQYLASLRDDAERTADAIAFHHELVASLQTDAETGTEADPETEATGIDSEAVVALLNAALDRYPHVASITILASEQTVATARREVRLGPQAHHLPLNLRRELTGHVVEVVVTAPKVIFDDLRAAGDEAELYERLLEQSAFVSATYLWVYIGFLALIAIIALIIGVILSRRVTSRVTALALATRRVGAGDLDVALPTGSRDEVHELTVAFNTMVRDLRESRTRIEYLQRIGAWQDFARRLAHEIKNPLTPIQLAAQEMHRSYDGSDPQYLAKLEDAYSIIEEEVTTLRRLVSEFSSFARLPAADLSCADLRDFLSDIKRTLPAIRDDVYPDEDSPGPSIEIDVQDTSMPVRIDAMMLKRCIDNLVRNAFQALRGRDDGLVRIVARVMDGEVIVRIEDNGPGVPEAQRGRVFDPYFTTKSDGTGLGLAIVKKVVLEHGGRIGYQPSALDGACFCICLPRDP